MLALGLMVLAASSSAVVTNMVLAASEGDVITGKVRLTRDMGKATVSLVSKSETVELAGELAAEVARLQSARVEVRGVRDDDKLYVKDYVIVEVSGVKPMVGVLVDTAGGGFALRGQGGMDIPLSISPRTRERLHEKAGIKLWVYGKTLLSGELKVLKYGILREPPKAKKD